MNRLLPLLGVLLLVAAPLTAHAATQPGEAAAEHRCSAAASTDDYDAELTYCQQAAENYAVDASEEDGWIRWADNAREAGMLISLGQGRYHSGADPTGAYTEARSLLADVHAHYYVFDAHVLPVISRVVDADTNLLNLLEKQYRAFPDPRPYDHPPSV